MRSLPLTPPRRYTSQRMAQLAHGRLGDGPTARLDRPLVNVETGQAAHPSPLAKAADDVFSYDEQRFRRLREASDWLGPAEGSSAEVSRDAGDTRAAGQSEPRRERHRTRSSSHKHLQSGSRLRSTASTPPLPLVFQAGLDLRPLRYNSRLARALYLVWCWGYLFSVLAVLFFDYTALYIIAQIAIHPGPQGGTAFSHIAGRPLANLWWLAFSFYAATSVIWLVGVVALKEFLFTCHLPWRAGNPSIIYIYSNAAAFNFTCTRSFTLFCFLWRLRLAAFCGLGRMSGSLEQGIRETMSHFAQNGPTVLADLPRGALILILLLGFNAMDTVNSTSFERDPTYFLSIGTLTINSTTVLTINLALMVLRLLCFLSASAVMAVMRSGKMSSLRTTASDWPATEAGIDPWQASTKARIVEAVRMCCSYGSTTARHHTQPSDYRQGVSVYIPVDGLAGANSVIESATYRTSSIPMRQHRKSGDTGESVRTMFQPNLPQVNEPASDTSGHISDASREELERLEWERHPPLSPRGRMMQARQELAAEQEEQSYWTARPLPDSHQEAQDDQYHELEAIAEESEEEASLRRSNSNRQTLGSRQSSLRRPNTALGVLDENQIESEGGTDKSKIRVGTGHETHIFPASC